jgi:hypothetical protein
MKLAKRALGTFVLLAMVFIHRGEVQTTTGSVTGSITDSAGAPLPQAAIHLKNTSTGIAQNAVTDNSGNYIFALVPPGAYEITVERQGFQRFVRTFNLEVAQQARIDAPLPVGQVNERVEVSESAVLLETDASNLGQVINNRQVTELPLNGCNAFALAALTPWGYATRQFRIRTGGGARRVAKRGSQ